MVTTDVEVSGIVTRQGGGYTSSTTMSVESIRTQDDAYLRAALVFGFAAADPNVRFVIPWVLTTTDSGEPFANLLNAARPDQS